MKTTKQNFPDKIIIHNMIFNFVSVEDNEFTNWCLYKRNNNSEHNLTISEDMRSAYLDLKNNSNLFTIHLNHKNRSIQELIKEFEEKLLSILDFPIELLSKAIKVQKTKVLQ